MSALLTVTVEPGDPVVVYAAGEVDIATADRLRQPLVAQLRAGATVLDASSITFLDSQGISVLIAANNQAQSAGHRFVIRGAHGQALKSLEALGLHRVLTLQPA